MTTKKGLPEIVLYHGSLEELNSRSGEQFRFAEQLTFRSRMYNEEKNWEEGVGEELRARGWDGIVNRRTLELYFNSASPVGISIEGTPIVKNTSKPFCPA